MQHMRIISKIYMSFAGTTIHQSLRVYYLSRFAAETMLMNLCAHWFR